MHQHHLPLSSILTARLAADRRASRQAAADRHRLVRRPAGSWQVDVVRGARP